MDAREGRAEATRHYGIARMAYQLEQSEPLLQLGRAFADPTRIRILALLAQRSMYGQELAEALAIKAPTISQHIAMLKGAGLIQVRKENNYHHYSLHIDALKQFAHLLSVEHLRAIAEETLANPSILDSPTEAEDRRMVQEAYFRDGRLLNIPSSTKHLHYVLKKVAESFEWGHIYSEQEVNTILKTLHEEAATLRRALIDQKFMMRENGRYWLTRPRTV